MLDKHIELRDRTKQFALRVLKLCDSLPKTEAGRTIGRQLLRSGTSVAANYRAAGRARSRAEFAAKMGVVVEEADESIFWLDLLGESGMMAKPRLDNLVAEANELVSIFVASQKTARGKIEGATVGSFLFTRSPDHLISRYSRSRGA